jgi:hypothetical protein
VHRFTLRRDSSSRKPKLAATGSQHDDAERRAVPPEGGPAVSLGEALVCGLDPLELGLVAAVGIRVNLLDALAVGRPERGLLGARIDAQDVAGFPR